MKENKWNELEKVYKNNLLIITCMRLFCTLIPFFFYPLVGTLILYICIFIRWFRFHIFVSLIEIARSVRIQIRDGNAIGLRQVTHIPIHYIYSYMLSSPPKKEIKWGGTGVGNSHAYPMLSRYLFIYFSIAFQFLFLKF